MSYSIGEDGHIIRSDDKKENSNGAIVFPWILFGIAVIVAIIFYRSSAEKSNSYNVLETSYNNQEQSFNNLKAEHTNYIESTQYIRNNLSNLTTENALLEEKIEKIANKVPIIIDKVEFKSVKNGTNYINYGQRLKSSSIFYLYPMIYYQGNRNGYIDIDVKIYESDGSVSRGNSSPLGYTYTDRIYCISGENSKGLTGWGSETGRSYPSGTYRIEFWYDNICVGSKRFHVYSY